ncbi:MAG TPA: hypothetical protein VJ867_09690 [Gemmatimonadaceae bacterium]|nr:hypothetical protein [Gemmatimonadaceae bacterium]
MSRRAELLTVASLLLAAMLAAAALTDHGILFTRPLWLDEYHTVLVAERGTPAQVVRDLAHGADLAPPLLHLVVWTARHVIGSLTATWLHVLSFLAVWGALVFVAASLRRRFDVISSVAGAVAVASNSVVVSHTFEARYYGPWLLFAAFLAWSFGVDDERASSHRRDWLIGVASVLLCTIHWFGVLTWTLAVAAAAACHRERIRRLAPALAGPVATVICSPLLFMQRSLFTTPIWVPDLNATQVMDMGREFYLTVVPVLAAALWLASTFRDEVPASSPGRRPLMRDASIVALVAFGLMPVVVTLVSWLVQPTMLPRYAIAAALAWAPLAAFACAWLGRTPRILWCALLGALAWVHVRGEAATKRAFADDVAADVQAFDQARPTGIPIVFETRHVLYPVAALRAAARDSMALLVMPDALLDAMFPAASPVRDMGRFFRFEHDAVRLHVAAYGFPALRTVAALDSLPRFLLLARDASLPRGYKDAALFGRAVFPTFRVVRLRENLVLFTR